jgi:hypothetical protein
VKAPTPQSVAEYAIKHILIAMLKQRDDAPASAETHLCQAVMALNQIANVDGFEDPELTEELHLCRDIMLGRYQ